VEYKHIFFLPLLKLVSKILCHLFFVCLYVCVCIPRSFLLINVCNEGKTLCSPCIFIYLTALSGIRVELHRIRAWSQGDVWEEMRKERVFSEILTQRGRVISEKLIVP